MCNVAILPYVPIDPLVVLRAGGPRAYTHDHFLTCQCGMSL